MFMFPNKIHTFFFILHIKYFPEFEKYILLLNMNSRVIVNFAYISYNNKF